MKTFIQMNYNYQELCQLNRVRVHQQVVFLSDVCDANGRALDKKYLHKQPYQKQWSTLLFPKENLSEDNFRLWKEGRKLEHRGDGSTSARTNKQGTRFGNGSMTLTP